MPRPGGIGTGLNAGGGSAAGAEHTGAAPGKDIGHADQPGHRTFAGPASGAREQRTAGGDPLRKQVKLDEEYIR